MAAVPDFNNKLNFPAFIGLPSDCELEDRYYSGSGGFPVRHWCFLAQIKESVPWVRPMFNITDINGSKYLVAFHGDNRGRYPIIREKCKDGRTICIMYAFQHRFFDGQIGVRVEDESYVKVLPCSLPELFSISDAMARNHKICNVCGNVASLRCSKCGIFYCSKQCQFNDWKGVHKKQCKVVQQVVEWGAFDWNKFGGFKVFSEIRVE
ncbi:hypothetical protein B0H16DRAFT_1019354 [Mycena metata]|uniref:MYND-type domain-containing protein n=1 Tax=Mycena metata TaxID=1033252 RepID=A0AAD7IGZ5_9AGAR|nr:hypothetical protein B0H16DRAFT_1019354 [Mycena metata]